MNTLLILLAAQLSISQQSNQVTVNWSGNWILQSSSNLATWQTEAAAPAMFFRLVAPTNIFCLIRNGETNDFVVPVGSNAFPSFVWLAAVTEPLPTHPTFMVRSGQAHLHPPLFTDTGILRQSESRGVYDSSLGSYCATVEIQDRITTPLVIRVIGVNYVAHARFVNP